MLLLASKVISDDMFNWLHIYSSIEMPQFGKNKMCKKWVKLACLMWTVLYQLLLIAVSHCNGLLQWFTAIQHAMQWFHCNSNANPLRLFAVYGIFENSLSSEIQFIQVYSTLPWTCFVQSREVWLNLAMFDSIHLRIITD